MDNNMMMQSSKKGNNGLVVVLILIILGLGGYMLYDKVLKEKYFTINIEMKNSDSKVTITKEKKTDKKEEKTTTKTADERYIEYIKNVKKNISKNLSENTSFVYYGSDMEISDYYAELTHDYELYLHGVNDIAIEVSDDVVMAFLLEIGQSGNAKLYFVKDDGTLYTCDVDDALNSKKAKIEKTKFKNIVNITHGSLSDDISGFHAPIFIDIDGNVYD